MKAIKIMGLVVAMVCSTSVFADMSGKWLIKVDSPQASTDPVFELTQDGDKLSGTYTGGMGQSPVEGSIEDGKFTLNIAVDFQGQGFTITYSGQQDGDAISGDMDLGGMGGAPFTGSRQ
ncbi:hypothetical protein [Aurantivibrio plasticivorans]